MSEQEDQSRAMAAFLQGWLTMSVQQHSQEPQPLMKIAEVRIDNDAQGNLDPAFVVVFESGAAVKVTVEPFDPDAEINDAIRSIKGE